MHFAHCKAHFLSFPTYFGMIFVLISLWKKVSENQWLFPLLADFGTNFDIKKVINKLTYLDYGNNN